MTMGKNTGRMRGLVSLVVAGLLCLAGAVAYAASVAVSSPHGTANTQVTFSVTLSTGGASVGGTQNDITFDATNTPVGSALTGTGTCSPKGYCRTTTGTQCSSNGDCPAGTCSVTTSTSCHVGSDCPSGETCTNGEDCVTACLSDSDCKNDATCSIATGADCTAGPNLGDKQAVFSFPKNCSTTTSQACVSDADCAPPACTTCQNGETCVTTNKMRGIVAGINPPTGSCSTTTTTTCTSASQCPSGETCNIDPIPDGTVLYTCKVNIAGGAADGSYALTASNVGISDTTGTAVSPATGTNGNVVVGVVTGWVECDVSPSTGDNPGDFGTTPPVIDIFDVRAIFNAAQLGIDAPADGTARFSAMDSVTVDTPPTCGGNMALDIFDVRQCFNVGQLGFTNYMRSSTGSDCVSTEIPGS
jgi:hypothetical protein